MRYVRYEDEKSVTDIVNRLLPAKKKRSADEQKRAEDALLAWNPHLAKVRALPPGAAILVPDDPAFAAAPTAEPLHTPAMEMIATMRAALAAAQQHIEHTASARTERATADIARLKSRDVKKAAESDDGSAADIARVSDERAVHLAHAKNLRKAGGKIIATLTANLDAVAKRLE